MSLASLVYLPGRSITGFFNKLTGAELWKGATSVSNAGRKRGRAQAVKRIRDLNRGQQIGAGRINTLWPGLNTPVSVGSSLKQRETLSPDTERQERLIKIRDSAEKKSRVRLHSLERGWAGTRLPGRKLGAPDIQGVPNIDQFDSVCLEYKTVATKTGNLGTVRRLSCLMVCGNGDGLAGFAVVKMADRTAVQRRAKGVAMNRLQYVERLDSHTIYQDFYAECGRTKIFARRMPVGYGLVCHRALKSICEMVGIKDLYAKVEGSPTNYQALTKAFFTGLRNQETFQQLADRKRLHVVEFRQENNYFPIVRATPATGKVRKLEEIGSDEVLDVEELYGEGRHPWAVPKEKPFYAEFEGHKKKLWREHPFRNHKNVKLRLMAEGAVTDFSLPAIREWTKRQEEAFKAGVIHAPVGIGLSDVVEKAAE